MAPIKKLSPVAFNIPPAGTETRDRWTVALSYPDDDCGTCLIDLSHLAKWDLQGHDLSVFTPWGREIPEQPGESCLSGGLLINRRNPAQADLWNLAAGPLEQPEHPGYTETTDALCLLALTGEGAFEMLERITPLDIFPPDRPAPYLIQGPIFHTPCRIVVLNKVDRPTVLFGFSRGYGQAMADAVLKAGASLGVKPGGEARFMEALD